MVDPEEAYHTSAFTAWLMWTCVLACYVPAREQTWVPGMGFITKDNQCHGWISILFLTSQKNAYSTMTLVIFGNKAHPQHSWLLLSRHITRMHTGPHQHRHLVDIDQQCLHDMPPQNQPLMGEWLCTHQVRAVPSGNFPIPKPIFLALYEGPEYVRSMHGNRPALCLTECRQEGHWGFHNHVLPPYSLLE